MGNQCFDCGTDVSSNPPHLSELEEFLGIFFCDVCFRSTSTTVRNNSFWKKLPDFLVQKCMFYSGHRHELVRNEASREWRRRYGDVE